MRKRTLTASASFPLFLINVIMQVQATGFKPINYHSTGQEAGVCRRNRMIFLNGENPNKMIGGIDKTLPPSNCSFDGYIRI